MTDALLLLSALLAACESATLDRDAARFMADGPYCTEQRKAAYAFWDVGLPYRVPMGTYGFGMERDRVRHEDAKKDAYWCYECWNALEDVRLWGGGYVLRYESGPAFQGGRDRGIVRRQLAHLRELLGDEWYYTGMMPPAVPVWRLPYRE